jgi:hypothetical protein
MEQMLRAIINKNKKQKHVAFYFGRKGTGGKSQSPDRFEDDYRRWMQLS